MERVDHDGRSTAYRIVEVGADGPTALYVHGSGGTHRLWSGQYAPDGPAHPAVALDLSGHGASDDVATAAGRESLAGYVEDVVAVAEATGANVLVGNSLGGAVALRTVLEERIDLQALVLAGTGAKLAVHDDLREALATDFEGAIATLHGEGLLFHDPAEQVRDHSIGTMRDVGQSVTRRDFETCHRFDVRDRLDAVDVPTLAICGEHDRLTPPSYHEYLAEAIPDATFEAVPDCAHLAMAECPTAFNSAVAAFLEERGQ